jgi:RNA polymerase sigma-70 factor (ECF subfamily)
MKIIWIARQIRHLLRNPPIQGKEMRINGQVETDRKEFENLFSSSYQRAYNLAYRFTSNTSDAEDLVQDAFARAWGSYHRYDRKRPFEVWLLRILSNLAIDRWRRTATVRMYSLDQAFSNNGAEVKLSSFVADQSLGPEESCLGKAFGELVHNALEQLPDTYRTAIILTDIEQWTYEEVANRMRCPVGTVRSRLHRGRQLLRQHINRFRGEDSPKRALAVAAL